MGRSAAIELEQRKGTIEMAILDDEIALLVLAIEAEPVPEHLTSLAVKLQRALLERKGLAKRGLA